MPETTRADVLIVGSWPGRCGRPVHAHASRVPCDRACRHRCCIFSEGRGVEALNSGCNALVVLRPEFTRVSFSSSAWETSTSTASSRPPIHLVWSPNRASQVARLRASQIPSRRPNVLTA